MNCYVHWENNYIRPLITKVEINSGKKSRERLRADSILILICEIEIVYIYFIIFIIYIKNAISYITTKSHQGLSLCF